MVEHNSEPSEDQQCPADVNTEHLQTVQPVLRRLPMDSSLRGESLGQTSHLVECVCV